MVSNKVWGYVQIDDEKINCDWSRLPEAGKVALADMNIEWGRDNFFAANSPATGKITILARQPDTEQIIQKPPSSTLKLGFTDGVNDYLLFHGRNIEATVTESDRKPAEWVVPLWQIELSATSIIAGISDYSIDASEIPNGYKKVDSVATIILDKAKSRGIIKTYDITNIGGSLLYVGDWKEENAFDKLNIVAHSAGGSMIHDPEYDKIVFKPILLTGRTPSKDLNCAGALGDTSLVKVEENFVGGIMIKYYDREIPGDETSREVPAVWGDTTANPNLGRLFEVETALWGGPAAVEAFRRWGRLKEHWRRWQHPDVTWVIPFSDDMDWGGQQLELLRVYEGLTGYVIKGSPFNDFLKAKGEFTIPPCYNIGGNIKFDGKKWEITKRFSPSEFN